MPLFVLSQTTVSFGQCACAAPSESNVTSLPDAAAVLGVCCVARAGETNNDVARMTEAKKRRNMDPTSRLVLFIPPRIGSCCPGSNRQFRKAKASRRSPRIWSALPVTNREPSRTGASRESRARGELSTSKIRVGRGLPPTERLNFGAAPSQADKPVSPLWLACKPFALHGARL